MSHPSEQRIAGYVGRNDFDALLWDSGRILDSHELPGIGEEHFVEWTDNQDRECRLAGTIVVQNRHVASLNHHYGRPCYTLCRINPADDSVMYYLISARKRTVDQYDQDMNLIPLSSRIARRALVQSVLISYDAFEYPVLIDDQDEAIFAEIAAHNRPDGRLRRTGKKFLELLSFAPPEPYMTW